MAVPAMNGPYALTTENIPRAVTRSSPGSYVLGEMASNGNMTAYRSGRSDNDVGSRLRDHVGAHSAFFFAYASSAMDAFLQECELHHEYTPTENKIHPDRPKYSNWKCPRCNVLG